VPLLVSLNLARLRLTRWLSSVKSTVWRCTKKNDAGHLEAMQKMGELMKQPGEMEAWFASKQKEFEALPEN
jgi:hypothetical protein